MHHSPAINTSAVSSINTHTHTHTQRRPPAGEKKIAGIRE